MAVKTYPENVKPKHYRRFTPAPIDSNSALDTVLSMVTDSLKAGRPCKYPETEQGFADFKENVIGYFNFIKENNEPGNNDRKIIPDIEGLCAFLGITRITLNKYENDRIGEWREFIRQAKQGITACKKQLIFNSQIPPVVGIFDLTNNSGYINSSEFKLQPLPADDKPLKAADLPRLEGAEDVNYIEAEDEESQGEE